MNGFVEVN